MSTPPLGNCEDTHFSSCVESTDKCKIKQSFCSTLRLMFQTFVFAWCDAFLLYTPIFWFIRHFEWCINYQKTFFESASASHLSAQRARVARASAVFRFLPSPLHHTTIMNYETATCGWRLHPYFLHRWRQKKGISFTCKTHWINELRVKGKGEGRNRELAECAMRRDVSVRAYEGADEETGCDTVGEGTGVFSKKSGEEEEKRRNISQESPQVFIRLLPILEKRNIFLTKPRPFETKSLLLRLTKHNFPFIPPHCGVHIAQSRGTFPDPPAQTLFDLLNHRDFALSLPYRNSLQRRCPSQSGDICTTAKRPLGLVRKEGGANAYFLTQERGTRLLWQRALGNPIRFLSCPYAANPTIMIWFSGACFFEKESPKSYAKGLRVGFFCRFEVYRTAINSIITTSHHKNKQYTLHSGK